MSGQMLRAQGSLTQGASATWAIESPVPGVVLINLEIAGPKSLTPLHWRGGDWTKPPLDIELNPMNGAVQALQLVLQDEHVSRGTAEAASEYAVGIPVVELTEWPNDRYRDVRCDVRVTRGETNELIVRLGASTVSSRTGVPGRVMFGWDESANLCELVIGPLESQDWEDIDAFSGGLGGA